MAIEPDPQTPDQDGSDESSAPNPWAEGRWLILIVAVVTAVAIAAVIVALAVRGPAGMPGASADPSTSSGASGSATESAATTEPSESEEPDESEEPTAAPSENPIDEPAEISADLTAEIVSMESVDGEATAPGEVARPSIRVTVAIENETDQKASLATAVVTAYYGADRTPASELREPGGTPFPAEVAAGATATAVYIFSVPLDQRDDVTIIVDFSVDVEPLVFRGPAPA